MTTPQISESNNWHLSQILSARDAHFVDLAYKAILHRAPDVGGLEHYVGQLRTGVDKLDILATLKRSPEGIERNAKIIGLDLSLIHI